MEIIRVKDYKEVSRIAANYLEAQIITKPDSVIGLATGSSPLGMYDCIAEGYKNRKISYKFAKGFNLDEYYGLDKNNPQSFYYYLKNNFVKRTDFLEANLNVLDGKAEDIIKECEYFENKINSCGGIDFQILGIGDTGHIGFNEPESFFPEKTHSVKLNSETIAANQRFFKTRAEVPEYAITMGIGTIMKSKRIIMIASGLKKSDIVARFINGKITPGLPASILKLHNDFTLIVDEEAFSKVDKNMI